MIVCARPHRAETDPHRATLTEILARNFYRMIHIVCINDLNASTQSVRKYNSNLYEQTSMHRTI